MVKVLHIITLSEWGGAQRVFYDLVTNLPKDKFLVEAACGSGGLLIKKLKEKGIKIYEISSFRREISSLNDLKTLISLYRLIKTEKYDIVHCHSTKAGILGRIAANLAGVKKIYFTAHGWGFYNIEEYGRIQKLQIFLEKIAAKFSTRIICVSKKGREDGIKRKIAPRNKFLVIRNGINFDVKSNRAKIKKSLKIKISEIVIGMIGRLAYPKDPLTFLKTAKEIRKIFPQTKFILIGSGIFFKECENFIKENKLKDTVFLLGEKNPQETRQFLQEFDIFVLISKFEGLPITVIEAMFAGLPIVATRVGGLKELVQEGKNGFLVDLDKQTELLKKIGYLIDNPTKRKKMAEKSLKIAKENFTLDKMIKAYEKLYEER